MFAPSVKRHRLRIVVPAYPAFNIYSSIAKITTALGPVCVASAARELEGWDVEVIDENNLGKYGPRRAAGGADHERLQNQRPADVVGLYGGLTSTVPQLYRIARFYRDKGVVTVAGGQHFARENVAEALSSGVDYVIRGEAEETIKELLRALEGRQPVDEIRGLAFRRDGQVVCTPTREPLAEFDKLPLPDFSLVRYAHIQIYPVERIRGCGMECEFCTVKGRPRCASPERLLAQISRLVETVDARHFFIVDDLFGQQRDDTIRFCRMLRDYQESIGKRLRLTAQIRLDKAKDPDLLYAMREAGIAIVAIGFESPIGEELAAMHKHIRAEEMLAHVRTFHKYGFLIHGMFIFGYPLAGGATFPMPAAERVRQFKRFIRRARIDTVQVLLPVPLPGTELRRRLERDNRIYPREALGWEYYDGSFPLFEPDAPMNSEEMQRCGRRIMGHFYRFYYMFLVALKILSFPSVILFLHDLRQGWARWYRSWRNYIFRFGGWLTIRRWTMQVDKDGFLRKLHEARRHLTENTTACAVVPCARDPGEGSHGTRPEDGQNADIIEVPGSPVGQRVDCHATRTGGPDAADRS
jgi:radical SAM superfamily enzyme YgiQ (UPF0313 family)